MRRLEVFGAGSLRGALPPPPLVVQAACAMIVLRGAAPAAYTLADWILSPEGRQRLVTHGFLSP